MEGYFVTVQAPRFAFVRGDGDDANLYVTRAALPAMIFRRSGKKSSSGIPSWQAFRFKRREARNRYSIYACTPAKHFDFVERDSL